MNKFLTYLRSLLGSYLLKSGDYMFGPILKNGGYVVRNAADDGTIWFTNSLDDTCSRIGMYGKNHPQHPSKIVFQANDGTAAYNFFLNPDGTSSWKGKNLSALGFCGTVAPYAFTVEKSGTQYVAPADGWVWMRGSSSAGCRAGLQVYSTGQTTAISYVIPISSGSQSYDVTVPVRKGQTFVLYYTGGTVSNLRMTYVHGDV